MQTKSESHWFMLRLLLLMNALLISAIILMHSKDATAAKKESCSQAKNFDMEAFNSITVKLM